METETWALLLSVLAVAISGLSLLLQRNRPVTERQRELLDHLNQDIGAVQRLVVMAGTSADAAPGDEPWISLGKQPEIWMHPIERLTGWAGNNPHSHLHRRNRSLRTEIEDLRPILESWVNAAGRLMHAANHLEEVSILGSNADHNRALDEHKRAKETFAARTQVLQPWLDALEQDVRRRRDTRP